MRGNRLRGCEALAAGNERRSAASGEGSAGAGLGCEPAARAQNRLQRRTSIKPAPWGPAAIRKETHDEDPGGGQAGLAYRPALAPEAIEAHAGRAQAMSTIAARRNQHGVVSMDEVPSATTAT